MNEVDDVSDIKYELNMNKSMKFYLYKFLTSALLNFWILEFIEKYVNIRDGQIHFDLIKHMWQLYN
jgi:hypothetical protein